MFIIDFFPYSQHQLWKVLPSTSSQPTTPELATFHADTAKEIRCRYCDKPLCKGSSLRRQGTTVVCFDSLFEQLVKPPKSTGGN